MTETYYYDKGVSDALEGMDNSRRVAWARYYELRALLLFVHGIRYREQLAIRRGHYKHAWRLSDAAHAPVVERFHDELTALDQDDRFGDVDLLDEEDPRTFLGWPMKASDLDVAEKRNPWYASRCL